MSSYSFVVYSGDGGTGPFAVPFPFLDASHVAVSVDGVAAAFTWTTPASVELTNAAGAGARIELRRTTPRDQRLVDFTDGAILTEADLDTAILQQMYLAQEALDAVQNTATLASDGALDAGGRRLKNVATPTADADAATKAYADSATSAVSASAAAAASASTAASAAQTAAETARTGAETARTAAETARTGAETAQAAAETAQTAAEAAAEAAGLSNGDKGALTVAGDAWTFNAETVTPSALSSPALYPGQSVAGHAASNARGLIDEMAIASGLYAGAFRHRAAANIVWYWTFSAMTHAPATFTSAEIFAAVEACLKYGVVYPYEDSTAYPAGALVHSASGQIWRVNTAGTTAASPPTETSGFWYTGTAILEELSGVTAPTSWDWFIVDINPDGVLQPPAAPDSHDAYGLFLSALRHVSPSASWWATATGVGAYTFKDVALNWAQNNLYDEAQTKSSGELTRTFQGGVDMAGSAYTTEFLADNVEAWRTLVDLAALMTDLGDSAAASAASTQAAALKLGVVGLWDATAGRFRAYDGQTDHGTLTGDQAFIDRHRYAIWPWLHGMWTTRTEEATYADPVLAYTQSLTPGLFGAAGQTLQSHTFPLAEWWWTAATRAGWRGALDTMIWRVNARTGANVTILDAALADAATRAPLAAQEAEMRLRTAEAGGVTVAVSAEQSYTNGGLITVAHGLGQAPTVAWLIMHNHVAEANWSPGDEFLLGSHVDSGGVDGAALISVDATNIYVKIGAGGIRIVDETSGAASSATPASWRIKIVGALYP